MSCRPHVLLADNILAHLCRREKKGRNMAQKAKVCEEGG